MNCFEVERKTDKKKLKPTKLMTVTVKEVINQSNKIMKNPLKKARI